jgi:hypothetical protein
VRSRPAQGVSGPRPCLSSGRCSCGSGACCTCGCPSRRHLSRSPWGPGSGGGRWFAYGRGHSNSR